MGMRRGRTERRAPIARFTADDPPVDYKDIELFKGEGCDRCAQTGYRGRTAKIVTT